jgi:hypothetical protein
MIIRRLSGVFTPVFINTKSTSGDAGKRWVVDMLIR